MNDRLPRGLTPRLLNRQQAAAYCGVSDDLFERDVGVKPLRVFGKRVLWDRCALDRWLDEKSGLITERPKSFADQLAGAS